MDLVGPDSNPARSMLPFTRQISIYQYPVPVVHLKNQTVKTPSSNQERELEPSRYSIRG